MPTDSGIPDSTTRWTLRHRDTFDRETPATVEAQGTNILEGLYELWKHVLTEGITDAGNASFSSFHLAWGDTAAQSVDIDVLPFDNFELARLRQWASVPGGQGDAVLRNLAQLHLGRLQRSARWTAESLLPSAESRQLLDQVEPLTGPHELESLVG